MKWLPLLVISLLCACANAPKSPAPLPAKAEADATREPFVVQNEDGTATVQRESEQSRGLVIKPQIVVPTVPRARGN